MNCWSGALCSCAEGVERPVRRELAYAAAFNIIIAAVKHVAGFRHFCKISDHRVFNQIGGGPAGLGYQFVQARFDARLKPYLHRPSRSD
jgi:hypothetical protein